MNHLIISPEELRELWQHAQAAYTGIAPKAKYDATIRVARELFPLDRNPLEIANRFCALMVCMDSSREELNTGDIGVVGEKNAMVHRRIIARLWQYFGDTSRTIDPRSVPKVSEILI